MTVNELNTDELNELRETYYDQLLTSDEDILGDITSASKIPLSNVKVHYEGVYFVKDDFFCNFVDDELELDDENNCIYCEQKCHNGELCDEQQAGGFNK